MQNWKKKQIPGRQNIFGDVRATKNEFFIPTPGPSSLNATKSFEMNIKINKHCISELGKTADKRNTNEVFISQYFLSESGYCNFQKQSNFFLF